MIKPVFVPKAYIEEEGRRIKIENIIDFNPNLITIYFNPDYESHRILYDRLYKIKPFEVFIVLEDNIVIFDKEFSMLGSVDVEQTSWFSPDGSTFIPAFGRLEMYIHLAPKESDLDGNNES